MLSVLLPPGAGVGPSPGNVEAEKKAEASDLLQAFESFTTNHVAGRLCEVPSFGSSTETWEN